MRKEKKLLLWSVIFIILYFILDYFLLSKINMDKLVNQNIEIDYGFLNVISYILVALVPIGIIYNLILIFSKKIDLDKHYRGILFWAILFFIVNIISGVLGIIAYSTLDRKKMPKREIPKIEYKEFTNKYICLIGFIMCMLLMFVLPNYITGFYINLLVYAAILVIMILCFRKQLVHDFKIFKEYFREYMTLTVKTWLKSLVVTMIIGIILSIVTNTSQSNNQENLQTMFGVYPIFIALLSMLYAPFAEELLFRGVFRKFIKSKYLFIITSGVLFGLLHVIDDSKTLSEFSYVLVYSSLGMFLASLYYKTNNLFTNISFHFLQNTLGVLGMILIYLLK